MGKCTNRNVVLVCFWVVLSEKMDLEFFITYVRVVRYF